MIYSIYAHVDTRAPHTAQPPWLRRAPQKRKCPPSPTRPGRGRRGRQRRRRRIRRDIRPWQRCRHGRRRRGRGRGRVVVIRDPDFHSKVVDDAAWGWALDHRFEKLWNLDGGEIGEIGRDVVEIETRRTSRRRSSPAYSPSISSGPSNTVPLRKISPSSSTQLFDLSSQTSASAFTTWTPPVTRERTYP